jgi:hypothetical protein
MDPKNRRPPLPARPGVQPGAPPSKSIVGGLPWAKTVAPTAPPPGPPTAPQSSAADTAVGAGGGTTTIGGLPWATEPSVAGGSLLPEITASGSSGWRGGAGPPTAAARLTLRQRLDEIILRSPAWTVSFSLHCFLLLLLALWVVREKRQERLRLSLAFASTRVAATADTGVDIAPTREPVKKPEQKQSEIANTPLPPVESPQAMTPELQPATVGPAADPAFVAPALGMALAGREEGRKRVLLGAAGGSDATEAAVARALQWLASQQSSKDGLWSMRGPYADGGSQENRLAATALSLLALQGGGNTTAEGLHRVTVSKAWKSLLKAQQPDGTFDVGDVPELHRLYSHAQITIALCELYGMTRDDELAVAAERAVAYAVAAQGPNGGWRYQPGTKGDMSVTGWYMMALKTAQMAGLHVPPATFEQLAGFLDSVAVDKGTRYGYQRHSELKPASPVTAAVTAEGLLCRQYLGWPQRDPRLVEGLERLVGENMLDFEKEKDVYAWYYITQVAHHMDGDPWRRWNDRLRDLLPREQVAKGRERGSWDPSLDRWGHVGGRLFMTSFCALMLEVYYRHMPIYGGEAETR